MRARPAAAAARSRSCVSWARGSIHPRSPSEGWAGRLPGCVGARRWPWIWRFPSIAGSRQGLRDGRILCGQRGGDQRHQVRGFDASARDGDDSGPSARRRDLRRWDRRRDACVRLGLRGPGWIGSRGSAVDWLCRAPAAAGRRPRGTPGDVDQGQAPGRSSETASGGGHWRSGSFFDQPNGPISAVLRQPDSRILRSSCSPVTVGRRSPSAVAGLPAGGTDKSPAFRLFEGSAAYRLQYHEVRPTAHPFLRALESK